MPTNKEFACSYKHGGKDWSVSVDAADWADASRRSRAIGTTGQVDGELVKEGSLYPWRFAWLFGGRNDNR